MQDGLIAAGTMVVWKGNRGAGRRPRIFRKGPVKLDEKLGRAAIIHTPKGRQEFSVQQISPAQ